MKKVLIEEFIKKYSIGGSINSVNWRVDNGKLSVTGVPQDMQVISFVDTESIDLPDGVYSIYDTAQLRGFLGVLGDDINLKIESKGDTPVSFRLDDKPSKGKTKVQFVLSDPSVIPKESVEAYEKLTPFDMSIKFDNEFMTRFIKAKSALADLPQFSVVQDDDRTSFVLGYDEQMVASQVDLEVEATGTISEVFSFSADYLKDIFQVNKESSNGEIGISNKGAMYVRFDNDIFNVRYYLLRVNKSVV